VQEATPPSTLRFHLTSLMFGSSTGLLACPNGIEEYVCLPYERRDTCSRWMVARTIGRLSPT
jgi:hypothetical protein